MTFALGIAFVARARLSAIVVAAVVAAAIASLIGSYYRVDIGKAAGLLLAAAIAVALDERNPFRVEGPANA